MTATNDSRSRCRVERWAATAAVVGLAVLVTGCGRSDSPPGWPPTVGDLYPNLELRTTTGEPVSLSSFRGKVLLIELIGMSCPACNAYSGGGHRGVTGFDGVMPQADLLPIEDYLETYGDVAIDDPRFTFVQILLYDMNLNAPGAEDAQAWMRHFRLDRYSNYVLLYGDERLVNPTTYRMIPGFQLVDREFVLRYDSTGHRPRHNLYTELLPQLGKMLANGTD